ncbi:MAG: hypothetical protein CMM59_20415 [Rhodospirillaceae bacterium]|nr:hypothetical protein [Rhodospirillaceae bacterium]
MTTAPNSNDPAFRIVGGRTCLDFVNTADWLESGELHTDKFRKDADVVAWCRAVGLASIDPPRDALNTIRRFRAVLRRLFMHVITESKPMEEDLACLNDALESMDGMALQGNGSEFGFTPSTTLEQAVAVSAAALLARAEDRARLKICPGEACGWLFLDESRNRRRTWCSMEVCGNRAKARRHYQRKTGRA